MAATCEPVPIYNCHTHTFTLDHVPDDFLPFGLVAWFRSGLGHSLLHSLVANPRWRRRLSGLLQRLAPGADPAMVDRGVRFLHRLASPGQRAVWEEMAAHYPHGTRFVALPMDFQYSGLGKLHKSVRRQHAELLRLAAESDGRLIPFCAVDPRRGALLRWVRFWHAKGCRGLKVYPPLGYGPGHKGLLPVLRYAADHELPVISHCSGGDAVRGHGLNATAATHLAAPNQWRDVLAQVPHLRLCLAHFGGAGEWDRALQLHGAPERLDDPWIGQILDLVRDRRWHVYTDISYTLFTTETRLAYLKLLLQDERIADRVLFGTDFPMVEYEDKSEKQVCVEVRAALGEELWWRLAHHNPRRFLGQGL